MLCYVFSDSHGIVEPMTKILSQSLPDAVIHLGDDLADAKYLAERFPMQMISVPGNSYDDMYSNEPGSRMITLEGHRLYLCHGHRYQVKSSLLTLGYAAMSRDAEIALFGHTHIPCDETQNGIRFINPGSVSKGWLSGNSYARLTLTRQDVQCEIVKLPTQK